MSYCFPTFKLEWKTVKDQKMAKDLAVHHEAAETRNLVEEEKRSGHYALIALRSYVTIVLRDNIDWAFDMCDETCLNRELDPSNAFNIKLS